MAIILPRPLQCTALWGSSGVECLLCSPEDLLNKNANCTDTIIKNIYMNNLRNKKDS
jgi:hypothetical protein